MKNSLDHLNLQKQKEVAYIRKAILDELQERLRKSTSKRVARYRILKLVLYGSFARGTWFDDRKSGRSSDYDLLVIVSHKALTDMTTFWSSVEDRLFQDPKIQKDISLIVHTLRDVNKSLSEGQYFFTEVINQGVLLYDIDARAKSDRLRSRIAEPRNPNPERTHEMSLGYFEYWKKAAVQALFLAQESMKQGTDWTRSSAFQLHQAAEAIYRMVLLTVTLYAPATHHLGKLRQRCEAIDPRLAEAWGPERKPFKRYFELLRRAYVEARYSPAYETNAEILNWQAERVARLLELAEASCQERLAKLEAEAKTFKSAPVRS
ncbi:HEPN domain-containing protein [Hyphomonas sp.]|uniref:HEPN domain-containing protein n=1 Tax=Hyphomonas sp. TaxID=87 RepID=UPI003D289CDD